MKNVLVMSHDPHNGPIMVRGHVPLKELRHKYNFILRSPEDLTQAEVHYMDMVVAFHPTGDKFYKTLFQLKNFLNLPVVIDIDDLLDALPTDHPGVHHFVDHSLDKILPLADKLVVSTRYLASVYKKYADSIEVVENTIDFERFKTLILGANLEKTKHEGFILGWTGSTTHIPDLHASGFTDGVDKFLSTHEDAKAYFHNICPDVLKRKYGAGKLEYAPATASPLNYPSLCAEMPIDVMCVPLQPCPFNDAKSDLRLLDFAMFNTPLLASPRSDFIKHKGLNTMLYVKDDTPDGWFEALEFCYHHKQTLESVAKNAREFVSKYRTSKQSAAHWDQILSEALQRGPSSL